MPKIKIKFYISQPIDRLEFAHFLCSENHYSIDGSDRDVMQKMSMKIPVESREMTNSERPFRAKILTINIASFTLVTPDTLASTFDIEGYCIRNRALSRYMGQLRFSRADHLDKDYGYLYLFVDENAIL